MPSLPQILYGTRFIGRIEINRQLDIEHFSQTDCHIAVTAEIKVNLEGIGEDNQQGGWAVKEIGLLKAEIGKQCQHVGEQHLFPKPKYEQGQSFCKIGRGKSPVGFILKLRKDFFIQYDGPRYKLGEKSNKHKVVRKGIMFRRTGAAVDEKGQLLERKKTDAKGQQDMFQVKIGAEHIVYIFDEKVKILKIKQDSQINGNACRQSNVPCPLCFGKLQGIA